MCHDHRPALYVTSKFLSSVDRLLGALCGLCVENSNLFALQGVRYLRVKGKTKTKKQNHEFLYDTLITLADIYQLTMTVTIATSVAIEIPSFCEEHSRIFRRKKKKSFAFFFMSWSAICFSSFFSLSLSFFSYY